MRPMLRGLLAVLVVVLCASPAAAHKRHQLGPVDLEIGWAQEPAFAGLPNAVEVGLTRDGRPAAIADARFSVVVIFGEEGAAVSSEPLELQPVQAETGAYEAFLIPTRPGTYTFHLTGRVAGETVDEEFTSGPRSFDDVQTPADAQFPERDPTGAEIADRLERIDARLASVGGEEDGKGSSSLPTLLGGAALILALGALVVALARRAR